MRLVSAFLFIALTGSIVVAEEAKPADPKPEVTKKKVPYRVVKMLPESGQVLLYDKNHGNHVVAEIGQPLDGYTVDDIDDEEVTLLADNGVAVILTAPPPPRQRRAAKAKAQPVDPYVEAGEVAADGEPKRAPAETVAPVDPYADGEAAGDVRVASAAPARPAAAPAPIVDAGPSELSDPYGDPGIAAFADAVGATPAPADTAKPAKAKPAKKPAKPTASPDAASALAAAATGSEETVGTAPVAAAPAGSVVVARTELDAALGNFTKTAGTFRATFTPDGLRFDTVAEGSLLAKVGLRKGDVVTYVDGKPMRSIDDAASLYARAGKMRGTTIQVARDGKNVTLRVAIQ